MNLSLSQYLLLSALIGLTVGAQAEEMATQWYVSTGQDSHYVTEGRNNLSQGGIYWTNTQLTKDELTGFVTLVRGSNSHYVEWNLGVEYLIKLSDTLESYVGYQRLETYGSGDSSLRNSDNEFFSKVSYTQWRWLTPSLSYTYSTLAAGYFVELSLHSHWQLDDKISLSPYLSQGFDFQYATEAHNGANHFQLGIEANYQLAKPLRLSAHLARTWSMADIDNEAQSTGLEGSLDQTYGGLHLHWQLR
ncbi:hypothetical protein [Shewanella sp. SR44-3]|uniref:hypothetical protein n=1 Tax=unclassified Shewanella TaxID=196818 RepID=UPI0015FA3955|nr:hypothetical protein [Shewanella sp. SR44-3]MBB1268847.1 hypothetical protein [Shewanella sp. SR44-3]